MKGFPGGRGPQGRRPGQAGVPVGREPVPARQPLRSPFFAGFAPSFCGSPHANPFRAGKRGSGRSPSHPSIPPNDDEKYPPLRPFSRDTQPPERSSPSQHPQLPILANKPHLTPRGMKPRGPAPRRATGHRHPADCPSCLFQQESWP